MTNSDPALLRWGLRLVLGIALAAALSLPLSRLHKRRAKQAKWALRGWARNHEFKLLRYEEGASSGPFWWASLSSNYTVFRVILRDRNGEKRAAWVRFGSFLGGARSGEQAKVRWEKQ